jgi:hypothetical protein
MLAMLHRLMTRPARGWLRLGKMSEAAVRSEMSRSQLRLVVQDSIVQMPLPEYGEWDSIGCSLPIHECCWIEFALRGGMQFGVLVVTRNERESPLLPHPPQWPNECEHSSSLVVFGEYKGDPFVYGTGLALFDKRGICIQLRGDSAMESDERVELAIARCSQVCLQAFAFAHCKNVELVDCTKEHGPDEKFCRRQKVPSVIYKTLKIPGMTKRYADGGGHSGVEMRSHICRGHFATYTADKPLFGRPDGIGKFWHPAHVRGNAKHGAVVKDYEVGAISV